MFGALTFARAMVEQGDGPEGLFAHVDYLGSISGGTWFTTLLAFNGAFWEDVKNVNKPVSTIITRYRHLLH